MSDILTLDQKDRLRADAAYNKRRDDIAPAAEGAFKGALSSSLVGRLIKPKGRPLSSMVDKALIIGGTALGGSVGEVSHKNSIKKRDKARRLLDKYSDWDESVGSDAAVGGLMGGATSMWASKHRKGSRLKWGLGGAVAGAATSVLGGMASNYTSSKDKEGMKKRSNAENLMELGAIGGIADGIASPILSKLRGRFMKDKKMIHGVAKEHSQQHKEAKKNRLSKLDIFGTKDENKAIIDGISSKKNGSNFINKRLLKMVGKNIARQGLLGAGMGYGLSKLMNKKESSNQPPR